MRAVRPPGRTARMAQPERKRPVIVVGYDGSSGSREAVRVAVRHAGEDGKLYIVHAYPAPSDWLGYPNYDNALIKHERDAQALLDALIADAEELGATDYETEL